MQRNDVFNLFIINVKKSIHINNRYIGFTHFPRISYIQPFTNAYVPKRVKYNSLIVFSLIGSFLYLEVKHLN